MLFTTFSVVGLENIAILPYESASEFYVEYEYHCKESQETHLMASKTTFFRALEQYNKVSKDKQLRFARCKGHFQTCEVCNKAADLMKNMHMTKEQRQVFRAVKRLHLKQQAGERSYLDANREACKVERDEKGQPKMALLFSDGMTIYTTNTPKVTKANSKGTVKQIESRIIGVEVVCLDINTMFLYSTDDMVGGGALTMIEVQRQAMKDLQALLQDKGLMMPKKIIFQFDNCGENKVSLLISVYCNNCYFIL